MFHLIGGFCESFLIVSLEWIADSLIMPTDNLREKKGELVNYVKTHYKLT
jgi:hypothetical protein